MELFNFILIAILVVVAAVIAGAALIAVAFVICCIYTIIRAMVIALCKTNKKEENSDDTLWVTKKIRRANRINNRY